MSMANYFQQKPYDPMRAVETAFKIKQMQSNQMLQNRQLAQGKLRMDMDQSHRTKVLDQDAQQAADREAAETRRHEAAMQSQQNAFKLAEKRANIEQQQLQESMKATARKDTETANEQFYSAASRAKFDDMNSEQILEWGEDMLENTFNVYQDEYGESGAAGRILPMVKMIQGVMQQEIAEPGSAKRMFSQVRDSLETQFGSEDRRIDIAEKAQEKSFEKIDASIAALNVGMFEDVSKMFPSLREKYADQMDVLISMLKSKKLKGPTRKQIEAELIRVYKKADLESGDVSTAEHIRRIETVSKYLRGKKGGKTLDPSKIVKSTGKQSKTIKSTGRHKVTGRQAIEYTDGEIVYVD